MWGKVSSQAHKMKFCALIESNSYYMLYYYSHELMWWMSHLMICWMDVFCHTSCVSYWPFGKFLTLYSLDANYKTNIEYFFLSFFILVFEGLPKMSWRWDFFLWNIWIWIYWKLCSCPCSVTYDKDGHFNEHECSQASIYHSTFTILTSLPLCFFFSLWK